MTSKIQFNKLLKDTAKVFSQPSQSKMLDFFSKKRQEGKMTIPEKWFQTEIVREFDRKGINVDPNENKKKFHGYDFKVDNVRIELKTSGSFTYKGKHNRLLEEIRSREKHPDCWMFITVYNEKEEHNLSNELKPLGYSIFPPEMIVKTKPQYNPWCIILIVPEQVPPL